MVEQVWGVDREALFSSFGATFHGFRSVDESELSRFGSVLRDGGQLRDRPEAEVDPSFQQVIPYAVVIHGGRVLEVRRRARSGEARLHERRSIGIGGHIGPEDVERDSSPGGRDSGAVRSTPAERTPGVPESLTRVVAAGLVRELAEELVLDPRRDIEQVRFLGFINDDSNDVGRVHFGLAFAVEVSTPVAVREVDKLDGDWTTPDAVDGGESLESWSRFLLDALRSEPLD